MLLSCVGRGIAIAVDERLEFGWVNSPREPCSYCRVLTSLLALLPRFSWSGRRFFVSRASDGHPYAIYAIVGMTVWVCSSALSRRYGCAYLRLPLQRQGLPSAIVCTVVEGLNYSTTTMFWPQYRAFYSCTVGDAWVVGPVSSPLLPCVCDSVSCSSRALIMLVRRHRVRGISG